MDQMVKIYNLITINHEIKQIFKPLTKKNNSRWKNKKGQ
ncbi:Hypothetical protein EAG7_03302 [Klebsiella aerogenes]|nr:Hypothetical protein EAG7_03302 [Klebsiella aerogenes]CCG31793.1 hypothetical protein [Klebsiella aerogenes EA1509E]